MDINQPMLDEEVEQVFASFFLIVLCLSILSGYKAYGELSAGHRHAVVAHGAQDGHEPMREPG
ncbi:hypothetical protein [Novosphingobium terrae]|uniref:hypothetical protein n=1 Tax=Novosphingobium terrae TaxID=2726189 RepID=UPI0019801A1B|nr:hypothetical protein [Novosphingobium terrae]